MYSIESDVSNTARMKDIGSSGGTCIMPDSLPNTEEALSRKEVWRMFDRIAHRYDLLNRSLSLGQDVIWRKRMKRYLPDHERLHVLDLATGTADQLLYLASDERVASGVGMDLAEKMLEIGREKIRRRSMDGKLHLQTGDAASIPAENDSADVVTISFGIRNVVAVSEALTEMYRVLKPGGRALILEFSLPHNGMVRGLYLFYFRHILPRIGSLVSGDAYAYRYLNQTVETFPYGEAFCELMREAGFKGVQAHPLTFGIASIYRGDKE
jgi:demethylmenaquinone methyltransferase / 2-methoxy-6-polyprenyl-1,4-benzoquinol methylase